MNTRDYANLAIQQDASCTKCDNVFKEEDIRQYNHQGGLPVDGYEQNQWLSFKCNECGYDTAFKKLEIKFPILA